MNDRTRKLLYITILLLLFLVVIECLACAGVKFLQGHGIFYGAAPMSRQEFEDYRQNRDERLGWPGKKLLAGLAAGNHALLFDSQGSRVVPAFPDPARHPTCVSLYGDSFTWGSEVAPEETWGNVLATLLHCRVANYGIWGYGADQALLRFQHNTQDKARVVILGFLTENIIRNLNRYRNLAFPEPAFALKPRFILDPPGRLHLVPLPSLSYEQYLDLVASPEHHLDHEYFLPGGPAGIWPAAFPYTLTLWRGLTHNFHLRAKWQGVPHVAEFYRENHPSGALPLSVAILAQFAREARLRHQHPLILIIPTGPELLYYNKQRRLSYQPLITQLHQRGLDFVDAGPPLLDALKGEHPGKLFTHIARHLNAHGNQELARIVYDALLARRWLDKTVPPPSP